jgi:hypothetical protein
MMVVEEKEGGIENRPAADDDVIHSSSLKEILDFPYWVTRRRLGIPTAAA